MPAATFQFPRSAIRPLAAVLLGALATIACGAQAAHAQQDYKELRSYKSSDGKTVKFKAPTSTEFRKALEIARAGDFKSPEEERQMEDYFRFRIAELTWKENRSQLVKKRDEIKRRFLGPANAASSQAVHDWLNQILLKDLPDLAGNDGYHPAVRLNAMLIVADLNSKEPRVRVEAVPLPEALPVLLAAVADQDQHAAVRVAALRGVARHAAANLPAESRRGVASAMLEIVQTKEPPSGTNVEWHPWMRMVAADVLRNLASQGPEANSPEVATALSNAAAEADAPIWLRCKAAEALGSLEAGTFAANQVPDTTRALSELVVAIAAGSEPVAEVEEEEAADQDAAQAEEVPAAEGDPDDAEQAETKEVDGEEVDGEEAEPVQEPAAAEADNARPAEAEGRQTPAADAAERATKPREAMVQELAYQLNQVKIGLVGSGANRGLRAAADDAARQTIDELVQQIDGMLADVGNKKLSSLELADAVLAKGLNLQQRLRRRAPAAAAESQPVAGQ